MDTPPLKILHLLRAPLGGLFRHVADLVRGQLAHGHRIGIVADSTRLGPHPEGILEELRPDLAFGITRISIGRQLNPGDISSGSHISKLIRETDVDVVHGHGAKGGAFARLCAPGHPAIRAYTPHGGSLLYRPGTLASNFYIMLERVLRPRTDLFLFESDFVAELYHQKVGAAGTLERVVRNGVGPEEFVDIAPAPDAQDILFIGELRPVKGVDVLINAVAKIRSNGLPVTAAIVGSGPSRPELEAQVERLGLSQVVRFHGPVPARKAFTLGKLAVIPSRAESMPYIVLETAAAGVPLISTRVGGIPDIFGAQAGRLLPPDDLPSLVAAITGAVKNPERMMASTSALRERVRQEFSIEQMVEGVLAGYREALHRKRSISS